MQTCVMYVYEAVFAQASILWTYKDAFSSLGEFGLEG